MVNGVTMVNALLTNENGDVAYKRRCILHVESDLTWIWKSNKVLKDYSSSRVVNLPTFTNRNYQNYAGLTIYMMGINF